MCRITFRFLIRLICLEVLRKMCEKSAFFTPFPEQFDEYSSYRKSENGRLISAYFCNSLPIYISS